MANFFDQFDAPSKPAGGNFFDQFDTPSEAKKPEGGLVASLKQTGGQMVKSAGQLAADVLPGVDRDNALTRTGQGIIDANPTAVHSLADVAESPWTATKEAVGNAAASIGGVVGARLLGQGITAAAPLAGPAAPLVAGIGQGISWLGPTAMAALPSYGGIREQQIADDPNNEGSLASKALAGAGAATVGLIENRFGPQEWALKALSQGGRDALAKQFAANSLVGAIGKGAAKGAAIEGAEELVQNPIEQLASYQDPTTSANLQDTAFGGVMGALGGGVLGGGAGGLSRTITPSQPQQEQPTQPPQPAIDPNAGPLSKAASMATQTPELNPLAFTPMQPTGPELETTEQEQARMRAAQFQADAIPFEPPLSFEQGPQPVRATNQDGMPFERISPEDYDTLNPIRAGEGELLDAERPTAGRTRAPDAIEGQDQRRIGVADDGTQDQRRPMRTLGERVQPAQAENASTRALPYFTDQKAEQSARKALPFATEPAAQKKAAELSKKRNEPFTVIPHPALADRFAVVPFRNLRTPNEQGQAAQLAARAQAGQSGAMPRVGASAQQSAPDGSAAIAQATPVQAQPATETVTNGLPPAEQLAQETQAARGQEGAARSSIEGEPASWVIRNKETGETVMETFDRAKVDKLNTAKYEAVPILQHLQEVNRKIKTEAAQPTQAPAATDQTQAQQSPQAAGQEGAAASDPWRESSIRRGYDTEIEVDALALKAAFERESGEPIAWNQAKADAIKAGAKSNGIPEVAINEGGMRPGSIGINDGRHRIAVAAERGEKIKVMVPSGNLDAIQRAIAQPQAQQADQFGDANKMVREQAAPSQRKNDVVHQAQYGNVIDEEAYQRRNLQGVKFNNDTRGAIGDNANLMERYLSEQAKASFDENGNFVGKGRFRFVPKWKNGSGIRFFDTLEDAKSFADQYGKRQTEPQASRRRIGKGDRGQTIYENERGVRSYTESGFKYEEEPGKSREPKFMTSDELARRQGADTAPVAPQPQGERNGMQEEGRRREEVAPEAAAESVATHKDPGQPAEPVTAPVIAQAIQKSARNTAFNPVEARNWLMSEIDKAIADAPTLAEKKARFGKGKDSNRVERANGGAFTNFDESIGFVTFDVPGDGKFKVLNTKETLQKFRDKAYRSPGFAKNPDRPMTYGTGLAPAVPLGKGMMDLPDIGNAIEIARLKNGKDEDKLLDRFREASGGQEYDAWRAEQEAADEIAAREDEAQERTEAEQPATTADRFSAEVERRKQEREGPQQAQEQPKQAEQPSAPAAQEAQPKQVESFPVNPELESLFESLDGTSTRKANKAKKAIQSDPRADKINMVQDKFLDILQALEDSGAVKINCK